jgi:hypothetical protein
MSKKRAFAFMALAVCVIAAAGGLLASNMGFKLNYQLLAAASGVSATGKQQLALPYFRQTGINDSLQLMLDIGSGSVLPVTSVARFNKATDTYTTYTGRMGSAAIFPLVSGDGYLVSMNSNVNYIIVGAHDPSLAYSLQAASPGVSATGKNLYAPPYNIVATNSLGIMLDIGGGSVLPVANVARFNRATDTYTTYTGRMGSAAIFTLVPGDAYLISMNSTVPYIASHY